MRGIEEAVDQLQKDNEEMKNQIIIYERDTMSRLSAANALLLAKDQSNQNDKVDNGINKETVFSEINFLVEQV